MKKTLLALFIAATSPCIWAQKVVDLAGIWEFQIDRQENLSPTSKYDDHILLPGSMPQRLKGDKPSTKTVWTGSLYDSSYFHNPYMKQYQTEDNFKLPFFLTPDRHYEGVAWYRREVMIPKEMAGQTLMLTLERPHIISTLYINNVEVGTRNSLCVAHEYDITRYVKPGKKVVIALRIDNDHKKVGVGQDSHSVTDQTQGNWNGIVGRMEIKALPATHIAQVDVFPNAKSMEVSARVTIVRGSKKAEKVSLHLMPSQKMKNGTTSSYFGMLNDIVLDKDTVCVEVPAIQCTTKEDPGLNLVRWDEFNPHLASFVTQLLDSKKHTLDKDSTVFGFRDIETRGKDILVNGRPTLLRGTVENCDFPMTGYAPMDKEEWLRVFRKCKEYGLNHMRFHSYCPPEAAFEAADEVGFYLQPEGPSWPNHGIRLGNGMMIDKYLMEETQRMVKAYGNHPSFTMLSCGNEPAGGWVKWVSNFVDYWKKNDPRRIYTGASVGGSWAWQPKNQYHVKAGARGLDSWKNHAPESTENFLSKIDTVSQPFVSHETGQWCVFPDFEEIEQYTGAVNKGKNFEIFRDILRDKGMEQIARKFLMASGKLQVLCYKAEIERTLRTPHYAGYQLLGLNDYSGQGSALVGPLNVFWREKGYVTANEWREFSSPVTLLAEMPKFVYWDDELMKLTMKVSNYGNEDLKDCRLEVFLTNSKDPDTNLCMSTTDFLKDYDIPMGLSTLFNTEIFLQVPQKSAGEKLTLRFRLNDKDGYTITENHWDLYVFPRQMQQAELKGYADIYIAKNGIRDGVLEQLRAGKKVLLLAGGKWSEGGVDKGHLTYGEGISQQFTPVFWNTSWFKMRPPHTTGMYINQYHPLFKYFPTEDWSDVQWYSLMNRQPVMLMDNFPKDLMPIVQPIDTWFLSRKLGMLFEAEVESGKLMVSTMPYSDQNDPAQVAMTQAILRYMSSDEFRPAQKVELATLNQLFTDKTPEVNLFTNDNPDELKKGVR